MDNNTVKTNASKGVRLFAAVTLAWALKTLLKLQLVAVALFEIGIVLGNSLPVTQARAFAFGMQLTLLVGVMLWPLVKRRYNNARRFDLGLWVIILAVALLLSNFMPLGIAAHLPVSSAVYLGAGGVILYLLGTYALSALFDNYLFNKVLNGPYLGVERSDSEDNGSDGILKADILEDKVSAIEQQAIQDDYRDYVALSSLKKTAESNLHHGVITIGRETSGPLVSNKRSYQLEFLAYPFGFGNKTDRINFPFYVPLITIKRSYVVGEGAEH